MRSWLLIIWIICSVLAIWNVFKMVQFSLPSIANTATGKAPLIERFPPGINYTTFVTLYPSKRSANNNTNIMISENSTSTTDSPILDYFPDFCGDCNWGGSQTCQTRMDYLISRYNTQNAQDAVIKERATCKNPPLQIFWQDDGSIDEDLDNMFAQPKVQRGNITIISPELQEKYGNISIFVYETLRQDVGEELENKMRTIYAQRNTTDSANVHADIAIIDLFRSFPGRTDDSTKADIFVVPYAAASHCHSKPTGVWMAQCKHIPQSQIQEGVFDRLIHYEGNEKRHLFLNVINYGNSNPAMRSRPLSLTIGPKYASDIIVPYLNSLPSFQPSVIINRGEEWWTRPRTYSMTYFFGISNSRMRNSPRIWRRNFMEEVQHNWPNTLGGLPYAIRVMSQGKKPPPRFFTHMYEDSIFCPTLPGDTPPQKRFFDVILMGCIPVVLAFESQVEGKNVTSWHQPGGMQVEQSIPWAKGSGSIDPLNEIDYRSFVVEVKGGVENVLPTIEALMQNYTEIRMLQLNLMKYAPLFSYGMGRDSHKYPDAFSKILESLRFYLANL